MKFISLLLMAIFLSAQAAEEKKIEDKSIHTKSDDIKGSAKPSLPVVVNVTGNAQNFYKGNNTDYCKKEPSESWVDKLWTDPVATFTGLLAFVTAGLIYVGFRQEIHLRDTAKKELRAYLGYEHTPLVKDEHRRIVAIPRINNFGKTPATEVTMWVKIEEGETPTFAYGDAHSVNQRLLPGQAFSVWLKDAELNLLFAADNTVARKPVFLYGMVEYGDIYTRRWRMRFCFRYEPKQPQPHHFIAYHEHNDEQEIS